MKSIRSSRFFSLFVAAAFITTVTFSSVLTSCGGSSSGTVTQDSFDTFDTFQRETTDDTGKAAFTTSKLTNANKAEITLTLPNGQPAIGFTVDFSETSDGRIMFVAFDSNGTYQTTIVTADISNLSADVSAEGKAFYLGNGQAVPVGIELHKDITLAALIIVAGVSLVFAVSAIDLQNKINKVGGTIDPARLVKGEPDCFSINDLLDHFEIASDSVGLVFWTASTLASAGVNLTMDGLYEIILENITSSIKDQVEASFWNEALSSTLGAISISSSTNICWQLHNPFSKYGKIIEMRPDKICSTAADCSSLTVLTQDFNNVDGDMDGYTPAQSDCNDQDNTIYPGAPEICGDGIDQACTGSDAVCNLTMNPPYMISYPELPPVTLDDGGSGDFSLINFQGSFEGAGKDEVTDVRIFVNDFREQRVDPSFGGIQGSYLTFVGLRPGLNRIQVAAQGGFTYGSNTLYFTNTGTQPYLTLLLSWDDCQDLDLYVTEPDGQGVNPSSTTGNYGSITVDTDTGWGPVIYKTTQTVNASEAFTYYVKYTGCNASCGSLTCGTANYTVRALTPYGNLTNIGTLSSGGESTLIGVKY